MRRSALVAFVSITCAYAAIGPVGDLYIVNRDVSPDGFKRPAVVVGASPTNTSMPSPLIVGQKGDTFRLNVINQLTNSVMLKSTSIHWHGFLQAGTAWADGVVGVTQCPIAPADSFLYEFSSTDQAGTFWYHSHYSLQYCDGLRGPFVVYDPQDPHKSLYDTDNESTVITLADWYHSPAPLLLDKRSIAATPDATLINGLGRDHDGDVPNSPLAVVNVVPGKRYRFRLVSLSCYPDYVFSIDGHSMTIIEVDGVNHQPYTVNSIRIFAGQRYSFVLNANQTVKNYWIRANPKVGRTGFDGGINSAILRYQGAPVANPTTSSSTSNPMQETNLHPLENPGAPGGSQPADIRINLDITQSSGHYSINGKTGFHTPTVPVLLQIMSGARTPQELLPAGSIFSLPANKIVEISIPGGATEDPHPMHLHGHVFDVIRSAGSSSYNYVNPVRRDVVNSGDSGDVVTIRFFTGNTGPWILHCHIDWHLERGLAVVFAEDIPGIPASQSPPVAWDSLCPTYDSLPPQDH